MNSLRTWFTPGERVLEIGGGSGYQANMLRSWGCQVASVDLPDRFHPGAQHFPVVDYDGRNLPFRTAAFDRVFSSNVLEHVKDIPSLLEEVHRVMRPDGVAIHTLPSTTWRLWTTVTRFPWLVLRAGSRFLPRLTRPRQNNGAPSEVGRGVTASDLSLFRVALAPGPHGEFPSELSELYYFSRRHWRQLFTDYGFHVTHVMPGRLFYTGNGVAPALPLSLRQALSFGLGSSANIFVTCPVD